MRTPSPYHGNDWTDCAEIWYVVRGQLAKAVNTSIYSLPLVHGPKMRLTGKMDNVEIASAHDT